MRKSNLITLFDQIDLGENTLNKNIVRDFYDNLFQDVLLNIAKNHERPDFDRTMYSYREPQFKMIKTFECQATPTMSLTFNAMFQWRYNYLTEEYYDLEVTEIISPRIEWMGMKLHLDEWLSPSEVRKAIMNSANGLAVEEWNLINGVPQP